MSTYQYMLNDEHEALQFSTTSDYSHNSMNLNFHHQNHNPQPHSLSDLHRSNSDFNIHRNNYNVNFVSNMEKDNQFDNIRPLNSSSSFYCNISKKDTRNSNQSQNNQYDFGNIIPNVMHQSLSGELLPLQCYQSDFKLKKFNTQKHSNSSHETSYNSYSRDSVNQPLVSMSDINSTENPTKSTIKKRTLSPQTSSSTLVMESIEDPEMRVILEVDQTTFFQRCKALEKEQKAVFPERYSIELANLTGMSCGTIYDKLSPDQQQLFYKQRAPRRERVKLHTPRPSNSFILYRKAKHAEIMDAWTNEKQLNNNYISKLVAKWWRNETFMVKQYWSKRADDEKILHKEKYPDYKYKPRKSAIKTTSQSLDEEVVEEFVDRDTEVQAPSSMYTQSVNPNYGPNYASTYAGYAHHIAPNPHPIQQMQYMNGYQNFINGVYH